ncbi:hypothetical protein C8R45DRAFT_1188977 [Mycena sanguinolenta]|nr:hypothetical protein C8R45DRAFT_1188977 [Mycena sanguinolenta]
MATCIPPASLSTSCHSPSFAHPLEIGGLVNDHYGYRMESSEDILFRVLGADCASWKNPKSNNPISAPEDRASQDAREIGRNIQHIQSLVLKSSNVPRLRMRWGNYIHRSCSHCFDGSDDGFAIGLCGSDYGGSNLQPSPNQTQNARKQSQTGHTKSMDSSGVDRPRADKSPLNNERLIDLTISIPSVPIMIR